MSGYLRQLLADHEVVRRQAHRHILFVFKRAILMAMVSIVLWTAAGLVAYNDIGPYPGVLALLLFLGSLAPFVIVIYRFLWWRNELYVITNYRILQVEGILSKRTLDSSLGRINDVEMKQPLLGRLFDFGDIYILTGSAHSVNDLLWINQPFEFKKALIDAKAEFDGRLPASTPQPAAAPFQQVTPPPETSTPPQSQAPPLEVRPDMENTARLDSSERMVVSLTELRNAGVLSEQEYQDKLRQITGG